MNRFALPSLVLALMLATTGYGQITLFNQGSNNTGTVQTFGNLITIDNGMTIPPPFATSTGYGRRALGAANASYLPTGYPVNPTSDGSVQQNSPGYTIQFWFNPGQPTAFQYLFGDGQNVSPLGTFNGGAFRCFANGTNSLNGNLNVRGIPNQTNTTVAPMNMGPWVHLAFRYDATLQVCQWVVNGVPDVAIAQTTGVYNWTMGNLTMIGSNSTGSAGPDGGIDELRIYDFVRSDADIAADYMSSAFGTGPSGESNLPDEAYFDLEAAFLPHTAICGTNGEATDGNVRVITAGTLAEWGGDSPGQGGLLASGLMNFETGVNPYAAGYRGVPAQPVGYATPGIPSVTLGHNLSVPVNPLAFAIPDGINLKGLGIVLENIGIGVGTYTYMSPNIMFPIPASVFLHNDLIRIQFVAPDPAYQGGVGGSNQVAFAYSDCQGNTPNPSVGPHCRVEARGTGHIQVAGFWEIHNTGNTPISQVTIDLSTCTGGPSGIMRFWDPIGALNTGGALSAGTSYRGGSQNFTGLDFAVAGSPAGGYTEIIGGGAGGTPDGIQFDFQVGGPAFDACIDSLLFDSGIWDAAMTVNVQFNGDAAVGATVTVTYLGGATATGMLQLDPNDPVGAIVDL